MCQNKFKERPSRHLFVQSQKKKHQHCLMLYFFTFSSYLFRSFAPILVSITKDLAGYGDFVGDTSIFLLTIIFWLVIIVTRFKFRREYNVHLPITSNKTNNCILSYGLRCVKQ